MNEREEKREERANVCVEEERTEEKGCQRASPEDLCENVFRQKLDIGYCRDEKKMNLQENFSAGKFSEGLA